MSDSARGPNILSRKGRRVSDSIFDRVHDTEWKSPSFSTTNYLHSTSQLILENRSAEILNRPNSLAMPTLTLSIPHNDIGSTRPPITLKESSGTMRKISVSLLGILRNEYGDVYRPEFSVESVKKEMMEQNPYLATTAKWKALTMEDAIPEENNWKSLIM